MGMTLQARHEAIEKAIAAYAEAPRKEAIPLPYEGQDGPFIVISVPVDAVVFNPKSHRVKAQLDSHSKRELVEQDPFSDEAQGVIHEVLAGTDGFEDLKTNLKEYTQSDAGVVTREGLMVNANTRLAALRELDPHGHIRAAVLPSNASEADIDLLELALQMQRDFKQDYTFPNELWFIDDLYKHGYSTEDIAKKLNWAPASDEKLLKKGVARVEQSLRNWAVIREIQEMSDGKIQLTFFDDKKQALVDLDDKYERMRDSDPIGAERMKEARIAGIVAGCDYRDLRQLDGTSVIESLVPELEESDILAPELKSLTEVSADGDEDDTGGGDTGDDAALLGGTEVDLAETTTFAPLAKLLASSHDEETVGLPSGKDENREKLVSDFTLAVETAAEEIRRNNKDEKSIKGPIKALEEAVKHAKSAASRYVDVHSDEGFAQGKFEYLTKQLRNQLDAIDEALKQHKPE